MVLVRDVMAALQQIAPLEWALPGDRVGLQVGDHGDSVERVAFALDPSRAAVDEALAGGCTMLVVHHPVIWSPLDQITRASPNGSALLLMLRAGVACAAMHTNWDCAPGGVNDTLLNLFRLEPGGSFGPSAELPQFKLVTFVPHDECDPLMDALSAAGAGRIGAYSRCAFFCSGTGTFLGDKSTRPAIGEPGRVESVSETRLEMVVSEGSRQAVLDALLANHPYEEPAYDLVPLAPARGPRLGRIGTLSGATAMDFKSRVQESLTSPVTVFGDPTTVLQRVAVVGGKGDDHWRAAKEHGAQALVTGEVQHHNAVAADHEGFVLLEAGHFATEAPAMPRLALRLRELLEINTLTIETSVGRGW